MGQLSISERNFLIILFSVFIISLIYLDKVQLRAEEPKRAVVSMEMNLSGNYMVPTTFSKNYYSKPPLFNWVLAGLYNLIGPYNWVSRFVSLFTFILTSIGIYYFFKDKIGAERAGLSAIFYVLCFPLLFYGSLVGEIDVFYSLLVFLQVASIFHFLEKGKFLSLFLWSYFFMALGILTKGLPSIAFQAITLLVIFIYEKKFWALFSLQHILGILVGFGIPASYFLLYAQYYDPFPYLGRLFFAGSRRVSGGEADTAMYIRHFITFPFTLVYLMAPGVFFFIGYKKKKIKEAFQNKWVIYSSLFIVFNLILYLISPWTRLRYLFPFIPFLSIILGYIFIHINSKRIWFMVLVLAIVLIAAGMGSLFVQDTKPYRLAILIFIGATFLLAFFHFRHKLKSLYTLVFLLLFLRLMFAFTVLEARSKTDDKKGLFVAVDEVADVMGEKNLIYFSPLDTASYDIFGFRTTHTTIDRLSYAFAFYYERKTKKNLDHGHIIRSGNYYLVSEEYIGTLENIEIIRKVEIQNDIYYLVKG